MPFLPVTPAFFAALHDASVEHFVFEADRGRLLLTLLLDSESGPSHRQQQVVLSGIRHKTDVERVHRSFKAALSKTGRTALGYRLDEFRLLPPEALQREQGRLNVLLAIDHLPALHLDCQKITSQEGDFL
ncbi:hypothetical protein [Hymenobacter perfusus]|uniref:Uncharacterized protein n=1 Tax=Hymenobacter perfusus TaxID=1236770 RepID=A0A428JW64_9BACT|nr:hypothetical protein [Hymenobacter perfusus]RSK38422.1 hypothetical protein EI293_21630 [Hymenobacter perfusus]